MAQFSWRDVSFASPDYSLHLFIILGIPTLINFSYGMIGQLLCLSLLGHYKSQNPTSPASGGFAIKKKKNKDPCFAGFK